MLRWVWSGFVILGCGPDYDLTPHPPTVHPAEVTDCDFSQVADTDFWAYDCNPVFTTTGEGWAPNIRSTGFLVTEVFGHPFYQMWYSASSEEGPTGLGYAISDEGTYWTPYGRNPLLDGPGPQDWDADAMDALQVLWDPAADQFVGLYQGYNLDQNTWGLGAVTSPDGTEWTRAPENPVIDFGEPSSQVSGWCWPLGASLDRVAGYAGYIAGTMEPNGPCEAFILRGSDATSWQPQSQLFFPAGPPGAWDAEGFASLAVEELDGVHHLFYAGFGGWEHHEGYRSTRHHFFGHATTEDGLEWDRSSEPVPLHVHPDGHVTSIAAHRVDDRIHLWVTDRYDDDLTGVGYFLYEPGREGPP